MHTDQGSNTNKYSYADKISYGYAHQAIGTDNTPTNTPAIHRYQAI